VEELKEQIAAKIAEMSPVADHIIKTGLLQ